MPVIRKDAAQEKALAEITDALATISTLNSVLYAGYSKPIVINFDTGESGRNKYVKLTISADENDKEHAALIKMAAAQKAKLSKFINNRANKFNISLSKEDEAIMKKTVPAPPGATPKPKEEPAEEADPVEEEMSIPASGDQGEEQTAMGGFETQPGEDIDPYEGDEDADPEQAERLF